MSNSTRRLTTLGMLTAVAFISTLIMKNVFPVPLVGVPFLKYDPKDIFIAISGFIYGPLAALIISCTVSLIEMISISDTGVIGLAMNILATASFVVPAALIYQKDHTFRGAVIGLCCGVILTVISMGFWNYLVTPIYMETPRAVVASMMWSVFVPFNLIKSSLNAVLTVLLYKQCVRQFRAMGLISKEKKKMSIDYSSLLIAGFALMAVIVIIINLNK